MASVYGRLRRQYFAAKKIRQLRKLRHCSTASGYTLRGFDRHRCIFVHIPKCAGVSVCHSLFGNPGAGHYPLDTFYQVFGPADYSDYFKFTFVRNPWDRLLSAYLFLRQGGFNEADRRWSEAQLRDYPDFGRFVRGWLTPDNARSWVHFRPQTDFLRAPAGAAGLDFIGRYEHLAGDFRKVCERLGVRRQLGHVNAGRREARDWRDYYDEETRAIVAAVYRQDVEQLGYAFDTPTGTAQTAPRPAPGDR